MSLSATALERLLDQSEFDLVARTRRGKLAGENDENLRDLARILREKRDRARGIARQQPTALQENGARLRQAAAAAVDIAKAGADGGAVVTPLNGGGRHLLS